MSLAPPPGVGRTSDARSVGPGLTDRQCRRSTLRTGGHYRTFIGAWSDRSSGFLPDSADHCGGFVSGTDGMDYQERRRFFIVTPGRTDSTLLAAILADAGANFSFETPESWDPTTGGMEHEEIRAACYHFRKAYEISQRRPSFALTKYLWDIHRHYGKKHLKAVLDKAHYVKVDLMERPQAFSDEVRGKLEASLNMKATEYAEAQHFRRGFTARVEQLMSECDVLAAPTSTIAAAPIADRPADYGRNAWKNTGIFNLTGQPSVSVPCGLTQGDLPVGLMITGRLFEDKKVLQFANAFERATEWHKRAPDI